MFKFKPSKVQQSTSEVTKSVEEFVAFSKLASVGFPQKPTALAWDPILSVMAIGTQTGSIRVYGAPGVQFCNQHKQKVCIVNLAFIPRKGRLISMCADNSLHLWEINEKDGFYILEEAKSFTLGGLMKKITAVLLNHTCDILYLGTMCGNIYTLNVECFEMAESVIYQDVIIQNIVDNKKVKQGMVKAIHSQPGNPDCVLIGYQEGLLALWDIKNLVVVSTFIASQSLESLSWHRNGSQFISSHSDGSYVVWSTEDPSKPAEVPITPYGPFACKSIQKIMWKSVKGGDDYIVFSGGMPKSSYGEKNTLTIMCGDKHQVLDFSSRVVDFFTICEYCDELDFDNPHSLMILLEEELVAIDLESESWLPYKFPYLEILHSSPITCFHYCPDVHKDMWRQLNGLAYNGASKYSENVWPIRGGSCVANSDLVNNILVTGHENGSIKIWKVTMTSLQLLYILEASSIFVIYDGEDDDTEGYWPPFRKIGRFDSLSDDSRLAIRTLAVNDVSRTIIAGGAAGQIIVLQMLNEEAEKEIIVTHATIGDKWDDTLWCNPQPLIAKHGKRKHNKGLHVQCVVQLTPPSAVTSLAFHAEWNLVVAGISYGFLLYDIVQKKCVTSRYTLNVGDGSIVLSNISPKSKSLKKSFRESFRKLKAKAKVLKRERAGSVSSEIQEDVSRESSIKRESIASSPDPTFASSPSPEVCSFEGDGESHKTDDLINSVQCVYFAQSFIINNVITTPTLWVGTSAGCIYIYTISMPPSERRASEAVSCQLGKEIQMKHQAPILGIQITDHRGYPLPDPTDIQCARVKPADLCGSHRVAICTEEQIKVFTLPSMKSFCKYKVTALEGFHVSRVAFSAFQNKNDPKLYENCIVCISSGGSINVYSIPDLRKLVSYAINLFEDVSVPCPLSFARNGKIVHLVSSSEFDILSLSALENPKPVCKVEIPAGAREVHVENVVVEIQNVLQNGEQNIVNHASSSEIIHNDTQHYSNSTGNASQEIRRSSSTSEQRDMICSSTLVTSNASTLEGEHTNGQNSTQRQIKRAPLATIEELNSSEEAYLNLGCYSRT